MPFYCLKFTAQLILITTRALSPLITSVISTTQSPCGSFRAVLKPVLPELDSMSRFPL